jgi:hypothetical protein
MKRNVFKVLAGMLGIGWIVLGIFAIVRYGADRNMRVLGALAIIGFGIYCIAYAITGKARLIKRT